MSVKNGKINPSSSHFVLRVLVLSKPASLTQEIESYGGFAIFCLAAKERF